MKNKALTILEELYKSEINFELSCFWDGGYNARLGDNMNGWQEYVDHDVLTECIQLLALEAVKLYTDSGFAKWWANKS